MGYLQADVDPLGRLEPAPVPELDTIGAQGVFARQWYCGAIGAEFMHIPDPNRRRWIQEKLEAEPPAFDTARVLERLISSEIFEDVLHARYPGTKRFSLEGAIALIPLLDEILIGAADAGAAEVMLGMSHRGRLNAIVHIVGRDPADVFAGFEDAEPRTVLGGGDVKYHLGASGTYSLPDAHSLQVQLVSNPSHLEAVYPVVLGRARARQARLGDRDRTRVLPIVLHGDGAFAGQGIVAETLNLADLEGFSVGGTIHVIVNNLIGFTTESRELHSTRFATDVAKRLPIPVFHVNGEDLTAVVRAGQLAAAYRDVFKSDVVVDLIGYRRYGHSEVDDPTVTHPALYARIKNHPALWQRYGAEIGTDAVPLVEAARTRLQAAQETAAARSVRPTLSEPAEYWSRYRGGCYRIEYNVDTRVSMDRIDALSATLTSVPSDFHPHPKIARLLQQRADMIAGRRPVDFGMAETLALATLLGQGVPVRFCGQDSCRGTFSQRHAVLVDVTDERRFVPLAQAAADAATFEIYNSPLSEAAVLGFEYGYSRDYPEALVLWEAQFGDFANNAQVIIDQFIASAEDKWRRLSGLTLLLPHGYEGQGPEHSSGRLERFLQLAAEDNLQICQPSTAAQYFHVLRRQALSVWRTPLVVFTPKSLLRHAASVVADSRIRSRTTPAGARRQRCSRRESGADLHRQDWARVAGRACPAEGHRDGHRVDRAADAVSIPGARGRIAPLFAGERRRVGARGAGEHGCSSFRHAAAAAPPRGTALAFGTALGVGESRDRFVEGARHRAEGAPRDRVRPLRPPLRPNAELEARGCACHSGVRKRASVMGDQHRAHRRRKDGLRS